jgi:hypothetical protein
MSAILPMPARHQKKPRRSGVGFIVSGSNRVIVAIPAVEALQASDANKPLKRPPANAAANAGAASRRYARIRCVAHRLRSNPA